MKKELARTTVMIGKGNVPTVSLIGQTKKAKHKENKVNKLKGDKAELQRMCEESVKLVELWTAFSSMQSKQIEVLLGRGIFGRVVSVFIPRKNKEPKLKKMTEEFQSKFKDMLNDSYTSETDTK